MDTDLNPMAKSTIGSLLIQVLVSLFWASIASAEPLAPSALVSRCYAQLTGERLPRQSALRASPPADEDAALKICDNLIDSAVLDPNSGRVKDESPSSPGPKVLNNLYDFHRSWFGSDMFAGMQGANPAHIEGTTDNFDSTEAALVLTRSALSSDSTPSSRYSSILEGKVGAFALREIDPVVNAKQRYPANLLPSRYSDKSPPTPPSMLVKKDGVRFQRSDPSSTTTIAVANPIRIGNLVGIVPDRRILVIPNYNPYTDRHGANFSLTKLNSQSAIADPNYLVGFNIYENQGGGILGLNSFLFMNWGLEPGMLQSGSLKMGRRWSEKVFNSLLCRELPVLRVTDVQSFRRDGAVADFRKSTACLTCHATMDPLSGIGRNLLISGSDSDYSSSVKAKFVHVMGRTKVSKPKIDDWPAADVPDYHLTPPTGRVLYRTSGGQLVDEQIASFEEAGAALKKSPDLYRCATFRYFEFLTGIKMSLYDREDPAHLTQVRSESQESKEIHDYLTQVAGKFATHQNLRTLMKELVRSKYFKDAAFRPGVGP